MATESSSSPVAPAPSGEVPRAEGPGEVDVLVTGAAGFIGGRLLTRLQSQGRSVQGVDLRAGEQPTLHMDVTDGASVLDLFERLRPRRVVHAAAVVDDRCEPELFQRVNVGGTQNLLDAAAAVGVERVLHISSIAALGLDPGKDADESTPLCHDTGVPYFDTKAASEQLVRQASIEGRVPAVIVRPGDVFGPGSESWVLRPLGMMLKRMPLLVGRGKGLMAHTWIDNLLDGLVLALDTPRIEGLVFQITDGVDTTTYRDYFQRLAAAADIDPPGMSIPTSAARGLGSLFDGVERLTGRSGPLTRGAVEYITRRATYRIDAARQVLGYAPAVGFDEAFERLTPWVRAVAAGRG